MRKIVILIFFLIELQSILCIPRVKPMNETDQLCVRSPKKIDYSIPIGKLWKGKFYFTKDVAPECKKRPGILKMKFIKYRKVRKYNFRWHYKKYKTYNRFNKLRVTQHKWYQMTFNDEERMMNIYDRIYTRYLFTQTCTYYRNNSCPYFVNNLYDLRDRSNNITYNGIRVIGKCVMVCIELDPEEFLSNYYCFQYPDPLAGLKGVF